MSKYFQSIPKEWSKQDTTKRCEHCHQDVDTKVDHFILQAHWKIKNDVDTLSFCSMGCLQSWIEEDSLVEA